MAFLRAGGGSSGGTTATITEHIVTNNTTSYSEEYTLSKSCKQIIMVIAYWGTRTTSTLSSYDFLYNSESITPTLTDETNHSGSGYCVCALTGSFVSGDVITCSFSLSASQSYLYSTIMY